METNLWLFRKAGAERLLEHEGGPARGQGQGCDGNSSFWGRGSKAPAPSFRPFASCFAKGSAPSATALASSVETPLLASFILTLALAKSASSFPFLLAHVLS